MIKKLGLIVLVFVMVPFLVGLKVACGQAEQDKLNAIDNLTNSLVTACSGLGEVDTNHMILCNNLLETINEQCQQVSFSFCNVDVFGLQD